MLSVPDLAGEAWQGWQDFSVGSSTPNQIFPKLQGFCFSVFFLSINLTLKWKYWLNQAQNWQFFTILFVAFVFLLGSHLNAQLSEFPAPQATNQPTNQPTNRRLVVSSPYVEPPTLPDCRNSRCNVHNTPPCLWLLKVGSTVIDVVICLLNGTDICTY